MSNRFLVSVAAAALIAGTGLANAQGTGMGRDTPSAGSSTQQSAPSAPMNRIDAEQKGSDSGMKASQSEEKMQPKGTKNQRDKNMNADSKSATDSRTGASKSAAEGSSQTTTGQAGAGAKLSTEQRTQITSVIREQHVAPVTNVNFSVAVGTKVPRTVEFHRLPEKIVIIYPEWRGYEYFLVRDQIVVVNPRTLEIVAVLEA